MEGVEQPVSHFIARCSWLKSSQHKNLFGINNQDKLWSTEIEDSCFIPVKFIKKRYVSCKDEIIVGRIGNNPIHDKLIAVIPLPSKSI